MSQTRRSALEAGTVWWEGELFAGKPELEEAAGLSLADADAEEQAFVTTRPRSCCRLTHDWEMHPARRHAAEVWRYIKAKGFLGMIIPKEYGGKALSAYVGTARWCCGTGSLRDRAKLKSKAST